MTTNSKEQNHGNTAEDSSATLPAPQALEDIIMREKEIKRQMRLFSKEDIKNARKRMGKMVNQHVVKFTEIMATSLKDNATLLQNVFDETKTPKRPDGQKSIKIYTDRFNVSITKK
jgi:hypothetical protein